MADEPRHDFSETPRSLKSGPSDYADPQVSHEARRAFIWAGVVVFIGLAIYLANSLLVIFGAVVFAALIDGGVRLLGRILPIGRGLRVMILMLAALSFLVWVALYSGSMVTEQAQALGTVLTSQLQVLSVWLKTQGLVLKMPDLQQVVQQGMSGIGTLGTALGGLIGGATTLFMIFVLGIYLAIEPRVYQRGVAWLVPMERREELQETAATMGHVLRRLLFGRVIGMVVEGIGTWAMLAIYGVPMAPLLGIITGLLTFIPNIGALLSGILMVLVGFSGGVEMGLYTILVYLVVQTVDGYLIVPYIARKTVDLAPALVLAAQLIFGVLFGILGLALADPIVAMIKVWLERQADLKRQAAESQGDSVETT